jgi:predicted RND superfamily exporter protein
MKRLLHALSALGTNRPWLVLGAALVWLVIAGALSSTLTIDSSRHSMVSEDNPHQALQARFFERFGVPNTMIVVISGSDAEHRRQVAQSLHDRLDTLPGLSGRSLARIDADTMAEVLFVQTSLRPEQGTDNEGYLQSEDETRHYVLLFPDIEGTQQAAEVEPIVHQIREARDEVLADIGDPTITADLTGPAALVVDEQVEISRGIAITSVGTGLAILLILFAAFRSVRYALLALVPVATGVVSTMAVARLLFGELNMVTSSCSSILLGLGIDFGVFLLSRYGEFVRGGCDTSEAIHRTMERAGIALVIGSVTTAVAFLTTTTTEFTAYATLGVIVSAGLLLMMASTLIMMPALLWLSGRNKTWVPPEIVGLNWLLRLVERSYRFAVVLAVLGVVAGAIAVPNLRFNTRFYDFIPERAESARALLAIERDPLVTPLRATVPVEGIEPARELADRLRALDSVAAVHSPTDALPPLNLDRLRARIALEPDENSADSFRRAWQTASNIVARGGYVPSDLPEVLQAQFVSLDGEAVALQVIPAGDIWDPSVAARFYREVIAVAPEATGMAMHIDAHLRFIREGFTRAAAMAAFLILLVLAIAFRTVRDASLAFLPCVLGFAWMLGVMVLIDFPFDAANIVVLPLILGIGVDAGVHLMERVRQSERETADGIASLSEVVGGTGSAVALASCTTMAGFAMLMLADYGAMQSLGLLMTIGIGCCLVASLWVLPAILKWTGRAH